MTRRSPRALTEGTDGGAPAHLCCRREIIHGERLGQMLNAPVQQAGERIVTVLFGNRALDYWA